MVFQLAILQRIVLSLDSIVGIAIQARRTWRDWGGCSSQIFAKVDLLPIDNDSQKKRGAKKHKPYQIPRKLLVTLLLSI